MRFLNTESECFFKPQNSFHPLIIIQKCQVTVNFQRISNSLRKERTHMRMKNMFKS